MELGCVSRKKSFILTDHQLRLMEVLWEAGHATVGEVAARVGSPTLAYSTVLTTLRTLEKKGYTTHKKDGKAFVYQPKIARMEAVTSALRHIMRNFFRNSAGEFAMTLLEGAKLSDNDVIRIREVLIRRQTRYSNR